MGCVGKFDCQPKDEQSGCTNMEVYLGKDRKNKRGMKITILMFRVNPLFLLIINSTWEKNACKQVGQKISLSKM